MATTEKPLIRAACYCRISSDPKDKREGVDRQREDTAIVCEVKGWQIAGVYVDNDCSASNGKKREHWERLLADIEAGKIDAVVAWDQDRVNRMMEDFMRYKKLFIKRGILLATSNNGDIDLATPSGVLTATIKTAVSEHEVTMMKVRMCRAATQKAGRGKPQWKYAFGYLPDTRAKEDDDGTRQVDPAVLPLVKDAYAAILAGSSLADVCKLWNDAGALTQRWARPIDPETGERRKDGRPELERRPWTPPQVSAFLRKPRNAGLRDHNDVIVLDKDGNPVKGTWPKLVDESTWRAAQRVLDAPGRKPGKKSVQRHLLTGVLQCGKPGCGGYLSGGALRTAGAIAYTCKSCRGVAIRAEHVEPLVFDTVSGRLAMADAVDLLKVQHDLPDAEEVRRELATLHKELHQIGVERGQRLLTGEQAQTATAVINEDIKVLERRQQDAERLRVFDGIPLGTPQVADAIEKLTPDRFRAVLAVLVTITVAPVGKGNHLFNTGRVDWDWK
jgi:DNA invertase Pin-like site-specific DNA recombinase